MKIKYLLTVTLSLFILSAQAQTSSKARLTQEFEQYIQNFRDTVYEDAAAARSILDKARHFTASHHLDSLESNLWRNYGTFFKITGAFDSAAICHHKARSIAEQFHDSTNMIYAKAGLALVYMRSNNLQLSKKLLLEIQRDTKPTDTLFKAKTGINLGAAYKMLGNNDSALYEYKIAMRLNEQLHNTVDLSWNYNNIANVYRDKLKFDSALYYYRKSLKINEARQSHLQLSSNHINLGDLYMLQKNYRKAIAHYQEAYDNAVKIDALYEMQQALDGKESAYVKLNDFKTAYSIGKESKILADSILTLEKAKTITELEKKYKNKEQAQQIGLLEKDNVIKATLISKKQQQFTLTAIALSLFVLLSLVAYRGYQVKKKSNDALTAKNERIETLIRELHHRTKNNLQVVSSLLSLQSSQTADPATREAFLEGQHRVEAMALIHQKLYMKQDTQGVDLEEYLKMLIKQLTESYGSTPQLTTEFSLQNPLVDVDKAIPMGLIVNELITNALKYAFKDHTSPALRLMVKQEQNQELTILVEDNGAGLSKEWESKRNESFGSRLIDALVKQLQGHIEYQNDHGLKVKIDVAI